MGEWVESATAQMPIADPSWEFPQEMEAEQQMGSGRQLTPTEHLDQLSDSVCRVHRGAEHMSVKARRDPTTRGSQAKVPVAVRLGVSYVASSPRGPRRRARMEVVGRREELPLTGLISREARP